MARQVMQSGRLVRALCASAACAIACVGAAANAQSSCARDVAVFDRGRAVAAICAADAPSKQLTVIDLSDVWVPRVLAGGDDATAARQSYRYTYLALADEQPPPGAKHASIERHLELFGIFPSFRVLRERLLDEARHECDAAISNTALESFGAGAERHSVRGRAPVAAIEELQAHLACAHELSGKYARGVLDGATAVALRDFQREQMIISDGRLDPTTRDRLLVGSRELAFRAVLRALRERVVDALGLIEDGSASGGFGQVLGRDLDPPELHAVEAYGPLEGGAQDSISAATEAAARELGWVDVEATARFFRELDANATRSLRVALSLPAPPAYYGSSMELRAEIDRGDVWYALPFRSDGSPRPMPVARRPTLVLYARVDGAWKPLMRWNTTIGGWQREQTPDGRVGLRYKGSPVGARVWRDLVAAPVWLPPPSTPDRELMRRGANGRMRPDYGLFGPGYRSAYGLAMLVHLKPEPRVSSASVSIDTPVSSGPDLLSQDAMGIDEGVRTHGSVAYRSILTGYSHGCHRLFNHLALRLMGFLLAHHAHLRHGDMPVAYQRQLNLDGTRASVRLHSHGYGYELTPPVPVDVLEGRILGPVRHPIRGLQALPRQPIAAAPGIEMQVAQEANAFAPMDRRRFR